MLIFLKLLLHQLAGNPFFDKLAGKDGIETKKCMNCLKKFELDWTNCPYCGFMDFNSNENRL